MRALLLLGLVQGCATIPRAAGPIERVEFPFRPGHRVDRLLVLIHGRSDRPRSFEEHGFLAELSRRAIEIDAVAVYAHQGYWTEGNLPERIHDDVILPKRQEGYREIYVLGVARGGLGAIALARRYANAADGLILFAPFLGPDPLVDEINAQGGLDRWRPSPPLDDLELAWQWLQGYGFGAPRPPLELMWGDGDRRAVQMATVEEVLPPERVHHVAGGHDWKTWRKLWSAFLDRDPLGWIGGP